MCRYPRFERPAHTLPALPDCMGVLCRYWNGPVTGLLNGRYDVTGMLNGHCQEENRTWNGGGSRTWGPPSGGPGASSAPIGRRAWCDPGVRDIHTARGSAHRPMAMDDRIRTITLIGSSRGPLGGRVSHPKWIMPARYDGQISPVRQSRKFLADSDLRIGIAILPQCAGLHTL
jgi:hypothetical protein